MYTIRFTNAKGALEIQKIYNAVELEARIENEIKDSPIECRVDEGMPFELHNAIVQHNSKIKDNKSQ